MVKCIQEWQVWQSSTARKGLPFLGFLLAVSVCYYVFEATRTEEGLEPVLIEVGTVGPIVLGTVGPVPSRKETDAKKTILLYDKLQGSYDHWKQWYRFDDDLSCPDTVLNMTYRCAVHFGTHSVLKEADLVVFSWMGWDRPQPYVVPAKKKGQIWAVLTQESPLLRATLDMPIDWVATYESDADVGLEYGQVSKRRADISSESPAIPESSGRNFGAALISHCSAPSRREDLIRDLRKENLKIDVYGKCGNRKLPGSPLDGYRYLSTKYKFFMSFENAICQDYVTEKFYNVLLFPWIPVVLGGANYSSSSPPNSHVNVMDFPSVRSLAAYLKYLDGNETAYLEYFRWKSDYIVGFESNQACKVCQHLHNAGERKKTLDLRKFSKERRCFLPRSTDDFFKGNSL